VRLRNTPHLPAHIPERHRAAEHVAALAQSEHAEIAPVQFVLSLDSPREIDGRCYWPIEARSDGNPWNTFYATPRGDDVLVAGPGGTLLTLDAWRDASR